MDSVASESLYESEDSWKACLAKQQEALVQELEILEFSNKTKYDHFTLKALLAGKQINEIN